MDLLSRITTPDQVKAIYNILTEDEKTELQLRRDFRGRVIIDISRLFHSGSISLEKIWKMPTTIAGNQVWIPVAEETSVDLEVPKDFVLYLFNVAAQHPWFQQALLDYYGVIPEIELADRPTPTSETEPEETTDSNTMPTPEPEIPVEPSTPEEPTSPAPETEESPNNE